MKCPSYDCNMNYLACAGADVSNAKREDAGPLLADTLRQFLYDLDVEDGLSAVGYTKEDVPGLVKGTIPQVNSLRLLWKN